MKLDNGNQFKFGKILVPFGADPLYHHTYGGLSGIDQKLLPLVWAEQGAVFESNLVEKDMYTLDNEVYAIAGISGDKDQVLRLNGVGNQGNVAVGDRLKAGWDTYSAALSVYWDRYDDAHNLFLWGLDFSAGIGSFGGRFRDRLAVKLGFLRAEIQGTRASGLNDYYHFGSYLQLDYRLRKNKGLRYRTGSVTMENRRGFFYDDRDIAKSAEDTVAHSFTLWKRYKNLTLAAELIINIEAAGEVDNDLFRLSAAIDF